jgi:hypothetical protein
MINCKLIAFACSLVLTLCGIAVAQHGIGWHFDMMRASAVSRASDKPPGWETSVLWWKFDESSTNLIKDYSASGKATGYVVGTRLSWSNGWFSFTNNTYVRAYGSNLTQGGAAKYTVAVWWQPRIPNGASDGIFFCRNGSPGAGAYSGFRYIGSLTNIEFRSAVANNLYLSGTSFPTNELYRLVVARASTTERVFYVNGVSNEATGLPSALVDLTSSWAAPADYTMTRYGNGWIDDAYITTNYVWSAAEAAADYAKGRSLAPQ